MAFNINQFRTELGFDGARPTLFEVLINYPQGGFPTGAARFKAKASNIPASTIGIIDVPYFGRKIKVAGDRTYDDWTCTFINDEDFGVRDALEIWSNGMDEFNPKVSKRVAPSPGSSSTNYVGSVEILQYGKGSSAPIKRYTLVNAFPNSVGQIDLSWEANDQIEEFDVQWSFDYFLTEDIR